MEKPHFHNNKKIVNKVGMVNMQHEFSPSLIDKEVYENIMVGNSRHGIEFDLKTTQMNTLPKLPIERFH